MKTRPRRTIVIVVPHFPPLGGGLSRYAFEIALRLQNEYGWRIVFIASGDRYGKEEKYAAAEGFTVYKLGYRYKFSNTPFAFDWFRKIRRILALENPDIVHIHTPVPGIGNVAALVSGKRPLTVTYHAGSMHKNKLLHDIFIWLYENGPLHLLLHRAERITCSSDFVRFGLLKPYEYKSATVTSATDADVFKPDMSKKSPHPTILFVASLKRGQEYKGLKDLITAVAALKRTIPDLRLTAVGDGDMRPEYESYALALGLKDSVRFTGSLSGNALIGEYQQAHIFALPSSNDSLPTVLIEAMACGLPVVSTLVGGIPEIVDDTVTGFLIQPGDSAALQEKIALLFANEPLAAQFGRACREKVVRNFSWDTQAEKYQRLFLKLLDTQRILVTHVVPYYPPHLGGMEQRVKDLATREAQMDLDVAVLTSNQNTPTGRYEDGGVKVSYLRSMEFFPTPITPALAWNLLRLKKKRCVIHLHVVLAFFPEVTAFVARMRGIPYIAHPRALIMPAEVRKHYPKMLAALSILHDRLLMGLVLRGAARVIALTPDYKEIIHERYSVALDKIIVIPNATNFTTDDSARKAPRTPIRLLAVGRIAVQKNYRLLIRVAEHLKKTHGLDFVLDIVGTGAGQAELEAEIRRLGLDHTVRFVGQKLGKDLEKMYEETDILVHTSLFEGFSTVFLEAMAKGVPIVATDVVGTRSVVRHGHNGLLAQLSADSVSDAVMQLARDRELYERISAENIEDVKRYKWETILEQTVETYRDSLKEYGN